MKGLCQRDDFNCAPVAYINVCKWLGKKSTYKDLPEIQKAMNTSYEGTLSLNFHKVLKKQVPKVKRKYNPEKREIDEHLESGRIIVMTFDIDDYGHMAVFYKKTKSYYYGWNVDAEHARSMIGSKLMRSYMRGKKGDACVVWFI